MASKRAKVAFQREAAGRQQWAPGKIQTSESGPRLAWSRRYRGNPWSPSGACAS
jgi:hypothetical protein